MPLTYDEFMHILGIKCIPTKTTNYSQNPSFFEVVDLNNTLKHTLPDNVKVSDTIDDVRLKSILKNNQTLNFTRKSFCCTTLGFTRSDSYAPDDIEGFYRLIAGSYKSEKPINITGIDKVHLKCDCIIGSFVKIIRHTYFVFFCSQFSFSS